MKVFLFLFAGLASLSAQIKPLVSTYLGDNQRNFYGNVAPSKLRVKWKTYLGSGKTTFGNGDTRTWKGAGWTGQPLVIQEGKELYLIQGTLSHHVKKIRARDGKVIWSTSVGDVIKGTPTFMDVGGPAESRYVLIVGSRSGYGQHWRTGTAHSLHGVSYLSGKILWRHNSVATASNSRDVDASAIDLGGKAAIPLENGFFTVFSPDARKASAKAGFPNPKIYKQMKLFKESDRQLYRSELCCESSPTVYRGSAYIAAGVGRVYACGFGFFGGLGWSLDVGGDLNGTMPLTNDNHLLLGIEKQFINGRGGVMKFKPKGGVKWYYPLPDREWYTWNGGLVGSPAVNHRYQSDISRDLACFVGIDGVLTLIDHKQVQSGVVVPGPRSLKQYPTPLVLDRVELPQGSISTPLFVGNKIIAGYDNGMDLYQVTPAGKLQRLDRLSGPMFDATPIVWNGRVYAGSKNGNLYCLGN